MQPLPRRGHGTYANRYIPGDVPICDRMDTDNPKMNSRKLCMIGLALATTVVCLDGTIIGTCGTIIARDLDGLELYSWMVTAFLLCETAMIPISGKMSDRFGRRPLMTIGLLLFLAGSVLAGLST